MSRSLKKYLFDNQDKLVQVLQYYKYHNFKRGNGELRCAKPQGTNATVCCIKLTQALTCRDFSSGFVSDIFGLIEHHTGKSYYEITNVVTSIIGTDGIFLEKTTDLFDSFFTDNSIQAPIQQEELVKYDSKLLDNYENCWNLRFVQDNILPKTQKFFKLGYDEYTHRITIPWFDIEGDLVGVMGRLNSDEETTCKYLPLIRFPKNQTMYNIQNIEVGSDLYVFESEKSVMLAHQYGYKNSIALGGNAMSDTQIKLLEDLNINKIILGYDEGLEKQIINRNLQYLRQKLLFSNISVDVIYDKDRRILPMDSKCSPVDLGKDNFEKLLKYCTKNVF